MPVLPGTRPGHDLSLALSLRAGVPIESLECPTHEIVVVRPAPDRAEVALAARAVVPNRDFVLRYRLVGERLGIAPLVHRGALGGFFALFLVPPADLPPAAAIPREVVFLVDASGSMEGDPLVKAKAVVRECLARLRDFDTFRLVCFSNETREFSRETRPLGPGDVEAALAFLDREDGHGGTEMRGGIRAALAPPVPEGSLRVVCLLTDGCIGSEEVVLAEVRARSAGTRVFSVGVGASVNRYLVDGVAREGGGEVLWALPANPAEDIAAEFARAVDSPCLAEIEVDFGGLPVHDLCPATVPDLRPGYPVLLVGRCEGGGPATVTVRGFDGAGTHSFSVPVDFPEWEEDNAALAQFWARRRVADLLDGSQATFESARRQALGLALEFGIVSPLTALVAVDESRETGGGLLLRVDVPVALPEGMSFAGNFGRPEDLTGFAALGLRVATEDEGLRVFAVARGSPAESAGIVAGDLVAGCVPAAGLIRLVVDRDGARREVTFRLAR
jgi:Ca-activated chloride channel family protein